MVKVISLVFVVVGMGIISKDSENKMNLKVSSLAPWYLIGFFIFCLFASFNFFPPQSELLLEKITSYLQTIALAAIGLRVSFQEIKNSGVKFLMYGGIIMLLQTVIALILIWILF